MKYGFLTTYKHTLFLKQEGTETDSILYCSAPIECVTAASAKKPSLRECLFYLQDLVNDTEDNPEPWRFVNRLGTGDTNGIQWYVKRERKEKGSLFKDRWTEAVKIVDERLDKWGDSQSKRDPEPRDKPAGLEPKGNTLVSDFSRLSVHGSHRQTRRAKATRSTKGVTFEETR